MDKPFDNELARMALEPNTIKTYQYKWAKWRRYCVENRLTSFPVDPLILQQWIEDEIETITQGEYIKRVKVLKSAHKYNDLDPLIPTPRTKAMGIQIRKRTKVPFKAVPIRRAEVHQICRMEGINLRTRAYISLASDTLARMHDMRHLEWSCLETVNHSGHDYAIMKFYTSKGKYNTYGDPRPLSHRTVMLLDAWFEEACEGYELPNDSRIFPYHSQTIHQMLSIASGISNIPFTSHSFRIGGACELAEHDNVSDLEIMHAGDWSSLAMVQRYTQQIRKSKMGTAKLMAARSERKTLDEIPKIIRKVEEHSDRFA